MWGTLSLGIARGKFSTELKFSGGFLHESSPIGVIALGETITRKNTTGENFLWEEISIGGGGRGVNNYFSRRADSTMT